MNKNLTLAVITYNGEKYLKNLFDSILLQDLKNVDILVSDNFSNDNTKQIINFYAKYLPSMVYIKQEKNIGVKNNIEFVIKNALTKFVWILADDDELSPNAVEKVKKIINNKISVVLTNFSTINNDGDYLEKKIQNWKDDKLFSIDKYYEAYEYSNHSYGLISSIILNKEKWINLPQKFNKDVVDEFNFLLKVPGLFTIGDSYFISEPLIKFRKYKKKWELEEGYINTFNIDHMVLPEIFNMLLTAGYEKQTIKKSKMKNISGIFQSIYAIKINNNKLKLKIWLKLINNYSYNYRIFLSLILYLLPKNIIMMMSTIKLLKKFKKRI